MARHRARPAGPAQRLGGLPRWRRAGERPPAPGPLGTGGLRAAPRAHEAPMKVLFVTPAGGLGGGERSLLDILSVLRGGDVDASLLMLEPGPLEGEARGLGVETRGLPMPQAMIETGDFGLAAQGYFARLG